MKIFLLLTTVAVFFSIMFSDHLAIAHRVSIFAWVDGETVHTESKFSGGRTVNNGVVKVFDMDENLLLQGNTDENGEFSFQIPKRAPLRIKLEAGAGHGNEWLISAEEIGAAQTDAEIDAKEETLHTRRSRESMETPARIGISEAELKQIVELAVEKSVDQKLKPAMKILTELRDSGPGISEILGGIGYIFGLVGVAAYFKSRESKKDQR